MNKQLRPYQESAVNAVADALYNRGIDKALVVMATGTGKSFTAAKIIERVNELERKKDSNYVGRTCWQVNVEELLEQGAITLLSDLNLMPHDQLMSTLGNAGGLLELLRKKPMFLTEEERLIASKIGVVKADLFDIDKEIVVCSVQTLYRRLNRIPANHFDIVVADEADLFAAKTFQQALTYFTPKLRLGLTATPFRNDNMGLGDIFDEIVFEYGIDKAIAEGYLCQIDAVRVKTGTDISKVKTVGGELNQKELEVIINTVERNNFVVDKYLEYASGRQFLAFCCDVQHTIDLCAVFNERGIKTSFVVGDKDLTTDRKGVVDDFRSEEYIGLTNCMIMTAGVDIPNIGCVLETTPTTSKRKFLQQIGRCTRLKNEKYVSQFGQVAIVLDFIDNTSRHRLVNTWELDKAKPIEERTFVTKENKLKLIFERERRFKLQQYEKDQKVDLLALPTVEISSSYRMQEPATEKQLNWIASLGYDIENTHYTKFMCTEIIMALPASDKQVWTLRKAGYDVSKGVTRAEAAKAFLEVEKKQAKANTAKLKAENKWPFSDIN